jgi:uncharacterized membrane protein YadS
MLSVMINSDSNKSNHSGFFLPTYVGVFLSLATFNSLGFVPSAASDIARSVTPMLLTAGLAAIGLQTRLGDLTTAVIQPLILEEITSLFIAFIGFSLTWLLFV